MNENLKSEIRKEMYVSMSRAATCVTSLADTALYLAVEEHDAKEKVYLVGLANYMLALAEDLRDHTVLP